MSNDQEPEVVFCKNCKVVPITNSDADGFEVYHTHPSGFRQGHFCAGPYCLEVWSGPDSSATWRVEIAGVGHLGNRRVASEAEAQRCAIDAAHAHATAQVKSLDKAMARLLNAGAATD